MTINEAVEVLRKEYKCRIATHCPDSVPVNSCNGCDFYTDSNNVTEALKTVLDAFDNGSEIPNSSDDCVSRQAVIDRINWWFEILKQNPDILIDAIKTMPSVQAQQKITYCENCKHKHLEKDVWTCPFGLPGGPKFFCGYGSDTNE